MIDTGLSADLKSTVLTANWPSDAWKMDPEQKKNVLMVDGCWMDDGRMLDGLSWQLCETYE